MATAPGCTSAAASATDRASGCAMSLVCRPRHSAAVRPKSRPFVNVDVDVDVDDQAASTWIESRIAATVAAVRLRLRLGLGLGLGLGLHVECTEDG